MNGIYKPNRLGRLTHDNFFNHPTSQKNRAQLPPMAKKPSQHSTDSLYNPALDQKGSRNKALVGKRTAKNISSQPEIEQSAASSVKTIVKNRTGVSFRPSKGSLDKLGQSSQASQHRQHSTSLSRRVESMRLQAFDNLRVIYVDSRPVNNADIERELDNHLKARDKSGGHRK